MHRLLLALACGAAFASRPSADGARLPDVLVIVADDLSDADLDEIPTPSLDALAARGQRFARAYACPVCSPSRFALQFGRFAHRDGLGDIVRHTGQELDGRPLPDSRNPSAPEDLLSLADVLESRGYATLAAGKWHLSNERSGDLTACWGRYGYDDVVAGTPFGVARYYGWKAVENGAVHHVGTYNARRIAERVAHWWGDHTTTPRFAYVAFNNPHAPFHTPRPADLPLGTELPAEPTPREQFELAVAAMDHWIGRLLSAVELDTTLVLFLSDNGTPPQVPWTSEVEGRIKASVFEGGVRVPFIAAGPGVRPGPQPALVCLSDVLATLAELTGAAVPADQAVDSISFAPNLADPARPSPRRFAFAHYFQPNGPGPRTFEKYMVRGERYKLVDLRDDPDLGSVRLLFDLERDPDERAPLDLDGLDAERREAFDALSRELAELLRK